uniref:Pre-mRNA-splicing factor 38 n=1 Tax=Stomoxys calcitrans TaxID=35570 RepID=A0A1I8PXF5_STOCA
MANRTVKEAKNIHGTNPQYLIEKIIRSRIYDSKYWKEQCFALTAELLVDKAMELRYIGGVFGGNIKPTQFLCLTLKMLQIQPEKDIVVEFIKNEEFKYVRALGAFYLRLTGSSLDCYKYLEPLYIDNRKLRRQNRLGHFEIVYMDEFIDELLRSDRVCDIIMPRLQKRAVLEENNELEPKVSALDEDLDEEVMSDEEAPPPAEQDEKPQSSRKLRKERSKSLSSSPERRDGPGQSNRSRDYYESLDEYQRERDRRERRDKERRRDDRDRRGGGDTGGRYDDRDYERDREKDRRRYDYRDDRRAGGGGHERDRRDRRY